MNINDYVWIEVTDYGWECIEDYVADQNREFKRFGVTMSLPERHGRWVKGQFWCLMTYFDWQHGLLSDPPFFNKLSVTCPY